MKNEMTYKLEAEIDFCGAIENIRMARLTEDQVPVMRASVRRWARQGATVTITVNPEDD